MDILTFNVIPNGINRDRLALLNAAGLKPSADDDFTVIIEEDDAVAATGSRCGNILKYIAVAPEMQGMGYTAVLLTELMKNAFACGIRKLFLYTKPANRYMFQDLGFFAVAQTDDVLLMENRRHGIEDFLKTQPPISDNGVTGAAVMNCNPFTLGHRRLIEYASRECDRVYVFILSEDRSAIPFKDRLRLVREGTADLENVIVYETGDYLISSATFPDYFLKKETAATDAQCKLDAAVFGKVFAPYYGITRRYFGSEPFSEVTEAYNRAMEKLLPEYGVEFREIVRLEDTCGVPVSASRVRQLLDEGELDSIRSLVPETTYEYLKTKYSERS